MILHHYEIHLFKDTRGQRQSSETDTYAESSEVAIGKVRRRLNQMKDPRAGWSMEAKKLINIPNK